MDGRTDRQIDRKNKGLRQRQRDKTDRQTDRQFVCWLVA